MSTLFTAGVLFESAAVIYFHYCTASDLCPTYIRWLQKKWQVLFKKKTTEEELNRDFSRRGTHIENEIGFSNSKGKDEEDISTLYDSSPFPAANTSTRRPKGATAPSTSSPDKPVDKPLKSSLRPSSEAATGSPQVGVTSLYSGQNPMSDSSKLNAMVDSSRRRVSVNFKFEPDSDDNKDDDGDQNSHSDDSSDERAQTEEDEYADAVEHAFGLNTLQEVQEQVNGSVVGVKGSLGGRPSLQRPGLSRAAGAARELRESSVHKELMKSFRTRKNIKTIMGRDADDFKNAEEMENNVRWQKLAKSIDDAARVLFPATFFLFLAITFSALDRHG